jgi:FtsZ-binding cell division protein ZapB
MRLSSVLRSAAVASLLFTLPVLAQQATAPTAPPSTGQCDRGERGHRGMRAGSGVEHLERKLDRNVSEGRLSQAQAEQFKAEARQLRDEVKSVSESSGGQLTEAQREQFKERRHALREKIKAALGATAPQPQGA